MFKKKNLINIVFAFFILLLPVFIHKISWEITSESLTLKNIYLPVVLVHNKIAQIIG